MPHKIENLSIYLINLDRSADRLEEATQEFIRRQLSFERFSAVEGKTLSDDYIATIQKNQNWFVPLLPNEIACYASHINVLKYFLEHSDDEYALICEDDIALDEHIKEGLEAIVMSWPKNCDMLKCYGGVIMAGLHLCTIKSPHKDIEIIEPIKINAGTLCYLVNRKGAEKFVTRMIFQRPIDIDLQVIWEHRCNIFQTSSLKNGINSYGAESDIGGRKHKPFLPHIFYKINFYIRNIYYNIKKWGFIQTLKLLIIYRIERLKRKWVK